MSNEIHYIAMLHNEHYSPKKIYILYIVHLLPTYMIQCKCLGSLTSNNLNVLLQKPTVASYFRFSQAEHQSIYLQSN